MLTKFCFSTLRPKIRFKNRPTSVASLSFTTKVVSVKPMDIRHCYDRKKKQTRKHKDSAWLECISIQWRKSKRKIITTANRKQKRCLRGFRLINTNWLSPGHLSFSSRLPASPFVHLFQSVSVFPYQEISISPFVPLFYLSPSLFLCGLSLSVCLCVRLCVSVCLSICLSVVCQSVLA